jgi:hypothetical protein
MDNKKVATLVTVNLGAACLMVVLFSPGLVGLSLAGSALQAALAAALGITIPAGLFMYDRSALSGKKNTKGFLDDKETDWNTVKAELTKYENSAVLGKIAAEAVKQIGETRDSSAKYGELIDRKFGGGLSQQKFAGTVDEVMNTVRKNLVRIYNRMTIFDEKDYLALQNYRNDEIDDKVQEEKIALYKTSLESMKQALSANERLMSDLCGLMLKMSDTDFDEAELMEQSESIHKLTEELKYYE